MYDSLRRRFITMSTFEGSGDGPIRKPMTPLHTKMQNMAGMIYTAFMLAGCFFFVLFFFFCCFFFHLFQKKVGDIFSAFWDCTCTCSFAVLAHLEVRYLVFAILPRVLGWSFWNFADALDMIWSCACVLAHLSTKCSWLAIVIGQCPFRGIKNLL